MKYYPDKPVKIIVYVKGGNVQNVISNLPDESWEFKLVDYDNEPDLSDDHNPIDKEQMNHLPDIGSVLFAAQLVVARWETGALDDAVRNLDKALKSIQ